MSELSRGGFTIGPPRQGPSISRRVRGSNAAQTPAAEPRRSVLRRGLGIVSVRVEGRVRIVTFGPGIYWNVTLRAVHDAFFGPADPRGEVRFVVMLGALFMSSDERPALCRGQWPETPA